MLKQTKMACEGVRRAGHDSTGGGAGASGASGGGGSGEAEGGSKIVLNGELSDILLKKLLKKFISIHLPALGIAEKHITTYCVSDENTKRIFFTYSVRGLKKLGLHNDDNIHNEITTKYLSTTERHVVMCDYPPARFCAPDSVRVRARAHA